MLSRYLICLRKRQFSTSKNFSPYIDVTEEVRHAINQKQGVVALESTIITHGMPYPHNFDTAQEVEEIIRANGVVPATIAILGGRIKIGLTKESLRFLASCEPTAVYKCSRRDLPYVVSNKKFGGTTVSGTMVIAQMLGLKIFATGGIGGVHRHGQDTMDISADLVELGRTPVAVVCSGVKSILDIPRTLEFLETHGVCVATYGEAHGHFPDFYTRDSGLMVPYNLSGPSEAAELIKAHNDLNINSGILIAVPIPDEYAADKQLISLAIDEAHTKAHKCGIFGKDLTPYLLEAIFKITKGASLDANMALIKNNASKAAQIAKNFYGNTTRKVSKSNISLNTNLTNAPLVIGGSILDISLTINTEMPKTLNGQTIPTQVRQSAGGVGRNLAEGIYKIHGHVNFISAVGNDQLGQSLLDIMPASLCQSIVLSEKEPTSICSLIFDPMGDCKLMLGNMNIHESITPEIIKKHQKILSTSPLIVFDSNIPEETMACILQLAQKFNRPVFFEPTDMIIAGKPFSNFPIQLTSMIKIISPNVYELKTIVEIITGRDIEYMPNDADEETLIIQQTKNMLKTIQDRFDCILVTLGRIGVIVSVRNDFKDNSFFCFETGEFLVKSGSHKHSVHFYAAPHIKNIINVSGAGDSFSSGFIAGLLRGYIIDRCVELGFAAAKCALQSNSAVPQKYTEIELL